MPIVTVENAQIKTAAVEIKTLTISGRQLTLSVFRQIQEEDIFDENLSLKGIPWGTVNYFWKEDFLHLKINLLWQKRRELRRCSLYKESSVSDRYGNRDFYIKHVKTISNDIRMYSDEIKWMHRKEYDYSRFDKEDRANNYAYIQGCIDKVEGRAYGSDFDFTKMEEYNTALQKIHYKEKQIKDYIQNKIKERDDVCKKYDEFLAGFMDLPHLFIAV